MGYYIFNLKSRQFDTDYEVSFHIAPQFRNDLVKVLKHGNFTITWKPEKDTFNEKIEISRLYDHLFDQLMQAEATQWWKKTAVAKKYEKSRGYKLDSSHAEAIFNALEKDEYVVSGKKGENHSRGNKLKVTLCPKAYPDMNLNVSFGDLEEFITKHEENAIKVSARRATFEGLRAFVEKHNITFKKSDESEMLPDIRAYIDLE